MEILRFVFRTHILGGTARRQSSQSRCHDNTILHNNNNNTQLHNIIYENKALLHLTYYVGTRAIFSNSVLFIKTALTACTRVGHWRIAYKNIVTLTARATGRRCAPLQWPTTPREVRSRAPWRSAKVLAWKRVADLKKLRPDSASCALYNTSLCAYIYIGTRIIRWSIILLLLLFRRYTINCSCFRLPFVIRSDLWGETCTHIWRVGIHYFWEGGRRALNVGQCIWPRVIFNRAGRSPACFSPIIIIVEFMAIEFNVRK